MSVISLSNPLQPAQGLVGPPSLMIGFVTLTGDGTSGTVEIGFDFDQGFMWQPLVVHLATNSIAAVDWSWAVQFVDAQISTMELGENESRPAQTSFTQSRDFVIPRFVFRTAPGATIPRIRLRTLNISGRVFQASVWALRWPVNEFPPTWAVLFTAPP